MPSQPPIRIKVTADTSEVLQDIRALTAALAAARVRVEDLEKRLRRINKGINDADLTLQDSEA